MQTHPNLMVKVDRAIEKREFPIELDCAHTSFTTSMFARFLVQVNKKVRKSGGTLRVTNVDDLVFEGLQKTELTSTIEVTRAVKKGRTRG